MEKTKEELASELRVLEQLKDERRKSDELYAIKLVEKIVFAFYGVQLKDERKKSDELYAIKLVEKIVFALVSLLLITVAGAIIKLVVI